MKKQEKKGLVENCPFCGEKAKNGEKENTLIIIDGHAEFIYSAHNNCILKNTDGKKDDIK